MSNFERQVGEYPDIPKTRQSRFNIDSFKAEMNQSGIVPTHSYLVTFSPFNNGPAFNLSNFITDNGSVLAMRCESAILPGIRLLKDETIRRYGYGPIERVPYSAQFNDITLNWVLDTRGKIMEFFNMWMKTIVNYDSAGGRDMVSTSTMGGLNYSPYELGYKDSYSNPKMNIFIYDNALDQVVIYEIFDVFPSAINDVPVSWGEQDSALKLSIEFSYTDINIITPKNTAEIPQRIFNDFATIQAQFNDARYAEFTGNKTDLFGKIFTGSF